MKRSTLPLAIFPLSAALCTLSAADAAPAPSGPALERPWEMAGFLAVRASGEWGDRRDLMRREVLTWHPTFQGIKKTGSQTPLDFDRDILALWTPEGRIPAAEGRAHPQSYTGLGKALVALADFAADSGDPKLAAEKDRIVGAILASQSEEGYLGIVRPHPANPAAALWQIWNVHDAAYVCLGLIENYRLSGHRPSLEAARRYADFVIGHWASAPAKPGALSPIGFPEMLLALSEATGDAKYRAFAAATPMDGRFIDFAPLKGWRQELFPMRGEKGAGAGGADDAAGAKFASKVHPYRYFLRLIEQLRLHRADPDDSLWAMTRYTERKIADPATPGVFVTGANTRHEGWVEDQLGEGTVGEGCAVVHMVWWRARLIEADGDLSHGDAIERAIFNHLEASQEPRTGQTRYDCALSGERNFRKGAHCCDGNHKRFWARVEDLVFYRFPGGVAVDQFAPATAEIEIAGTPVRLAAETAYPADSRLALAVSPEKPATFAVRLRVPRWAGSCDLAVNGQPLSGEPVPGGIEIRREWKPGDTLAATFPMGFRWIRGMKANEGRAALALGPQVYCLAPSRNPALAGIKDWREIAVDPASVAPLPAPPADGARRPAEAKAKGWSPGRPPTSPPDLDLVFSDFPVADGRETYFRLSDPARAVPDELYAAPAPGPKD
jgi:hypothetical protein